MQQTCHMEMLELLNCPSPAMRHAFCMKSAANFVGCGVPNVNWGLQA